MYSREIDGELYDFGVSGKLIRNTLVMYDRQTESLWSQLLGEAVDGPQKGTSLTFVPSVHVTWEEWRGQHPETLALVKGYRGSRDSYAGYYGSDQVGVLGETFLDARLYAKEFVIGVARNGDAMAFPFSVLGSEQVVNASVGATPILVLFVTDTAAGVAFDRTVGGVAHEFYENEQGQLVDRETGSVWDKWSGEATAGKLAGSKMARIKSTAAFWFGWKDWYPETAVYGFDTVNESR